MIVTSSTPRTQTQINKLVARTRERVQIKIEVTPVLRGCVYDPVMMSVSEATEDRFGFAAINTLNFADLYAGKIMAALDWQHPRDLFGIYLRMWIVFVKNLFHTREDENWQSRKVRINQWFEV